MDLNLDVNIMNKNKRLMLGIPINRWLSPEFTISLQKAAFYLISNHYTTDINFNNGTILPSQRNKIMRAAQKEDFDLLFIDSDMIFDADAIEKVISVDGDLVGGICFMRRFPFQPVVFAEDKVDEECIFTGWKLKNMPIYPFRCAAVGAAFLYIRNESINKIFEHYEYPWNNYEMKNGEALGEDLSFFYRCNKIGLRTFCQPNVDIGHLTERIIKRTDHITARQMIANGIVVTNSIEAEEKSLGKV